MAKEKKLQSKPNPVLYFFAGIYFSIYCKRHFNLKKTGVKPKGPALILSNHTSNADYKFVVSASFPNRVSFLATYHWFTFKKLAFWLKAIGAIPKYQFTTDLESIKKIRYVVQKNKGLVYIAPEGTVYANGKLGYIAPSIAKMVKFLKVPVYTSKIQGAGLGMAKWTKKPHNIDHVSIDTQLLLTQEEVNTLSKEEIYSKIISALQYDEFEYQQKNNIINKDPDLLEGFETMFYKCPVCNSEFTLSTSGNSLTCSSCHSKATLKEDFHFQWDTDKQYFDTYLKWYDWQYETLKQEILKEDFKMEEEVEYATEKPGFDNYIVVGKGIMTLTHAGWDYKGTFEGSYVEEHDDPRDIFLSPLKVGKHFELPYKYNRSRVFYPKNGNTAMKWHLASRIIGDIMSQQ